MNQIIRLFSVGMLIALLAGCAAGPRVPAGDRSAPAQAYYTEGQSQEKAGHLVEATRMYQLALTLTPGKDEIASALERVQNRRQALAEERFQQGERDAAAGRFRESKIDYLAALRLWPDHAQALERLRSQENIAATQHGRHIVQKGETLAVIAKKYYGDYQKYKVLAEYNHLSDPTQIEIGQAIMIPAAGAGPVATAGRQPAASDSQPLAAATEESISEAVDTQLANYRDAGEEMLQSGAYEAAIVEFHKVLNVEPRDQKTLINLGRAFDAYGRQLWDREEIEPAREKFQSCLALAEDCPDCRPVVRDCQNAYKERLYNRGIAFFQQENPEAALGEWEIVRSLDPAYRNVQDYILKARKISDKLGKLKQQQSSP